MLPLVIHPAEAALPLRQTLPTLQARQMAAPPVVDGDIKEGTEWSGSATTAETFDVLNGASAPVKTQYWLGYDREAVYFAARAYDPTPKGIIARQKHTNVSLSGDDTVGLTLMPFGPKGDGVSVSVNALGTSIWRGAGGSASKREWQGEVTAAARIADFGWECEVKIPWRLMRLPSAGAHDFGLNFRRYLAREKRSYTWKFTKDDEATYVGLWKEVSVPEIRERNAIEFLPYTYFGAAKSRPSLFNSGLDFRTPLTQTVQMVGTVNPDVRNIEESVLSLDFSYRERLATESRPFFEEGSQYLDAAPFASQRIREFDAGLKVFGPLNDSTGFGILSTSDFGDNNATVGSFTHRFSTRTGMAMGFSRLDSLSRKNSAASVGFDTSAGAYSLSGNFSGSSDRDTGTGSSYGFGSYYYYKNLSYGINYGLTGINYDPALGYVGEGGITNRGFSVRYSTTPNKTALRRASTYFSVSDSHYLDGRLHTQGINTSAGCTFRSDASLWLSYSRSKYDEFSDDSCGVSFSKGSSDYRRNWSLGYSDGHAAGHRYRDYSTSCSYVPLPDFVLTSSYQHVSHFEESDLMIVGATWDLKRDWSVSGRMVRRKADTGAYFSLKRAGNKGAEYFVILGDPSAPRFRTSLILKTVVPVKVWR